MKRPCRLACLFVPFFPLAARLRSDRSLRSLPLALTDGKGASARVIAVTEAARRASVEPGLSLPQARARFPEILFKPRDPEAEFAARQALLEVADAFSPRYEEGEPGFVYVDITGEANESFCAESLMRRAARVDLDVHAGVADGKEAARIAAQLCLEGPVVVPPTGERAFLAPLPLSRLDPPEALRDLLSRWGIRTMGAFAALPEKDVIARLGLEGARLQSRSRGEDDRPLVPTVRPPSFVEGTDLEWAILELDPLLYVAEGLLDRLRQRLDAAGLACRRLSFRLKLDPYGSDARSLDLPAPTREVSTLLRLLRAEMEARPPSDPITGLVFEVEPESPRTAQLLLFEPPALSPDALSATLARLAVAIGADRVGSPRPVDGARPEAFSIVPFSPPSDDPVEPLPPAGASASVRVLRPRIEVVVSSSREGRPARIAPVNRDGICVSGRVKIASGPWRIEDGWWTGEPASRDYWDVELSDGALYRLFLDRLAGRWYLDAIYD